MCYYSLYSPVSLSHNKEPPERRTGKDKVKVMTKMMNFKAMISNLTAGFTAERSRDIESYNNLMNGGFNYIYRSRTIM